MMIPYIGITGFTAREQVRTVFRGLMPPPRRRFMVGVLCGNRTLRGIPTRWDTRRPLPAEIAGIFSADKHFLNLIHFRSSSTGEELLAQLTQVTELGGPYMHGVQLNMTWPAPNVLEQYRSRFPQSHIVLQVGVKSFEKVAHNSEKLLNYLRQYSGLIEYVLLDKSEGFGKILNIPNLVPYIETLYASDIGLGVVVAGGLSADAIMLLDPLSTHSSKLSIDAESRLRTADDELDIKRCRAYIIQSLKFFNG